MQHDISSRSNHEVVAATHHELLFHIDFDRRILRGTVSTRFQCCSDSPVDVIIVDAKHLDVSSVVLVGETSTTALTFAPASTASDGLGPGIQVKLPSPMCGKGSAVVLRFEYATTDECLALCWLEKEQTQLAKAPFMYSQCQAIHARTMLPCQDTPAVRTTFRAQVTTSDAGAIPLMGALCRSMGPFEYEGSSSLLVPIAEPVEGSTTTAYVFEQPVPIPSYLIALVAGHICGKDVSKRCRVYAEPSTVEKAAWEFAETERFVEIAESIAGPYEWQRYDLIVLPPSFPYGGMENPNLTFVTPTCIAGDRTLAELVAHEVCHSWSGNLVAISSWKDFWINEGFTTLLQRKITEKMHGKAVADYESGTGLQHLQDDVNLFGAEHQFTALRPDLSNGVDPDDAFSSVPYEKGFCFLKRLEGLVGEVRFDAWLKSYFATFRRQSICSEMLEAHFTSAFPEEGLSIDWTTAMSQVGMPTIVPTLDHSVRTQCNELADAVVEADATLSDEAQLLPEEQVTSIRGVLPGWTGRQHVAFLERLNERTADSSLRCGTLVSLDTTFGYNGNVGNAEVLALWFKLSLASFGRGYRHQLPKLTQFLSSVGRMKFVRPLFRQWNKADAAEANRLFAAVKAKYHPITRQRVAKDLGVSE